MDISYDNEADAVYIRLRSGAFSRNEKVDEHTIIDYDAKGNILGIELLSASKHFPKASLQHMRKLTA